MNTTNSGDSNMSKVMPEFLLQVRKFEFLKFRILKFLKFHSCSTEVNKLTNLCMLSLSAVITCTTVQQKISLAMRHMHTCMYHVLVIYM